MNILIRPSAERGHTRLDWLDSRHTFSFDQYLDPNHMQFRALRVLNEDHVAPGAGFPTHGHREMEIVTWMIDGALEHRDSMGTGSVIRAGDLQRMTAGTGVTHSEFNHSKTDPAHLLQIWVLPARRGLTPGYEERRAQAGSTAGLTLAASPDGRDGSLTIHQDVRVYLGRLESGKAQHTLDAGRHAWIQVARGALGVNGATLNAGDGAAVVNDGSNGAGALELTVSGTADFLLFDLN